MSTAAKRIFVTGGTGRTGRYLIPALLNRGYLIRAVTSKEPCPQRGVEWHKMDWCETIDFDSLVDGCMAVLHLGAELSNIPRMHRVNVEATEALAASAERSGVKFFCYTSTISVYGSPRRRLVTENTPVVTTEYDARSDYLAEEFFRAYARTKMLGEQRIAAVAKAVEYVIFRPTVIVDLTDILAVANWSTLRRALLAYRYTHHIYVDDVVHAIVWFMERSLQGEERRPEVSVFNLSNDDVEHNTYADFLRNAYTETRDRRFFCPFHAPGFLDLVLGIVKHRSREWRYPLGLLRYSPQKLYNTGYRHRVGIVEAKRRALKHFMRTAQPKEIRVRTDAEH